MLDLLNAARFSCELLNSKYTSKFKGEEIRVFLAVIVIIVCVKMGLELRNEPPMNSMIIIQDAF